MKSSRKSLLDIYEHIPVFLIKKILNPCEIFYCFDMMNLKMNTISNFSLFLKQNCATF